MTKITECNTTEQEELFEVAVDINDSLLDLLPGDLPDFANVPKHAVPHEVSPPVSVGQMDDDVVADGNTTDKSTNKKKKKTLRRLEISLKTYELNIVSGEGVHGELDKKVLVLEFRIPATTLL